MEEEKKGFVVKDRRLFDESGEARPNETPKKSGEERPASDRTEPDGTKPDEPQTDRNGESGPLSEVTFAGFVLSLSTTAMYHLGDFPDPETKVTQKNLPAAKQTIDLLSLLKTKTEGNLDPQEKELLDGVLFELRMRFVKEMSGK